MIHGIAVFFLSFVTLGTQSYVPPPPPKLPALLSPEKVEQGRLLFEQNIYSDGKLEISNFLGNQPCSNCHDQKNSLDAKSLAEKFSTLREKINDEIVRRSQGAPLPLSDPALDALEQYFIHRYHLHDYKLSK